MWYNEFNRRTIKFSDINFLRNLRYTLRCDILLCNAICPFGTRLRILYHIVFEQSENILHERRDYIAYLVIISYLILGIAIGKIVGML